jgi:hypothetical protein
MHVVGDLVDLARIEKGVKRGQLMVLALQAVQPVQEARAIAVGRSSTFYSGPVPKPSIQILWE